MKITKSQLKQIIKEAIASTSLTKGMDFKMHPELAADIAAGKHNLPWEVAISPRAVIKEEGQAPSLGESIKVVNDFLSRARTPLGPRGRVHLKFSHGGLYVITEEGDVIGGAASRPRLILAEDVGP